METVAEIENRREKNLEEIRGIPSMERGSINEQYIGVPQKEKKEPAVRGSSRVRTISAAGFTPRLKDGD